MSIKVDTQGFRQALAKQGLFALEGQTPTFRFNLDNGILTVKGDADSVMIVIRLAHQYAHSDLIGEHMDLLEDMFAESSTVTEGYVVWNTSDRTHARLHADRYISLADYLKTQGKDPYLVFSPAFRQKYEL